jgi:hypothetical protein
MLSGSESVLITAEFDFIFIDSSNH